MPRKKKSTTSQASQKAVPHNVTAISDDEAKEAIKEFNDPSPKKPDVDLEALREQLRQEILAESTKRDSLESQYAKKYEFKLGTTDLKKYAVSVIEQPRFDDSTGKRLSKEFPVTHNEKDWLQFIKTKEAHGYIIHVVLNLPDGWPGPKHYDQ